MTDTFDAVLAEMLALLPNEVYEAGREVLTRLSAAHAAEVAERDARIAELKDLLDGKRHESNAAWVAAEAAERDARELRADIAKVYAMVPSLPVEPATCEAATDALHYIGLMMGFHDIDPAIATAEQADPNA